MSRPYPAPERAKRRAPLCTESGYHAHTMDGFWAVFWLAVILKIPIVALLGIVLWAIRQPPVPEADQDEGGGPRRDPHPRIRPPQPPRRGPHAEPAPTAPDRVRVTSAGPGLPTRHDG